jgi:hypothetical protein
MDVTRLRVNAPQVIHETIDGEVIIINLASGNYYSAKGCGADVWDVIQQSRSAVPEIVAAVAARFARPAGEIEADVVRFLDQLRAEDLVADDVDGEPGSPALELVRTNGDRSGRVFEPPVLEKYTDMQDLVLLDPVHEVDTAGWPEPRPEASVDGPAA